MTKRLLPTADQTVGPFFRDGLVYPGDRDLVPPGSPGSVRLDGRVLDGAGEPMPDALIEIWQPGPDGAIVSETGSRGRRPGSFTGFGRCETDPDGWYAFTTLEPAPLRPGAPAFFAVAGLRAGSAREPQHADLPARRRGRARRRSAARRPARRTPCHADRRAPWPGPPDPRHPPAGLHRRRRDGVPCLPLATRSIPPTSACSRPDGRAGRSPTSRGMRRSSPASSGSNRRSPRSPLPRAWQRASPRPAAVSTRPTLATRARASGNPVIPLLEDLRSRLSPEDAAVAPPRGDQSGRARHRPRADREGRRRRDRRRRDRDRRRRCSSTPPGTATPS